MSNVTDLIINGQSSNRIDIVFMGDGYTSSEIASTYASQIDSYLAYMFGNTALTEPFGTYANFFNVHRIDLISEQSGADNPGAGINVNTALNASYYWDGVTDRLLYIDDNLANAVLTESLALKGYTGEMRFVTVNSATYGGGGGRYAVFSGGNTLAHEVALHEVGHSFAALADEYGGNTGSYVGGEPWEANVTTDPTGSKWQAWLGYSDPNLGVIGAYNGGRYFDNGIYRPSFSSKMRDLNQPFDAVSREQFILKFYEYVDPLDDYFPNVTQLSNINTLYVTPIDNSVIAIDWTVNGKSAGHGNSINISQFVAGIGTYTISARAYDNTGWVRTHLDQVEENISWTVTLTVGNASAGNDTITGTLFGDYLVGLAGNDIINGGNGDDAIFGDIGNDTLYGGDGLDTMTGGLGDDRYFIDNAGDVVIETSSAGTDQVNSRLASYSLPTNVENLSLLDSAVNGTGNKLNNILIGNSLPNQLTGGTGDDILDGATGNDVLNGGAGIDTLVGGAGADAMMGGYEDDFYFVDNLADVVTEISNAGIDAVLSELPSYVLPANVENLTLLSNALNGTGNGLNNIFIGNTSGNLLSGKGGSDIFEGGMGNDVLVGGAGKDIFKFNTAGSIDKLSDFSVIDDSIQLENNIFKSLTTLGTLPGSQFRVGARALDANDFVIYNNANGALYYDSNGSGTGGAVQIATVGIGLPMTSADIVVI